ncbi:hypothetical protein P170DRAFT_432225 [Aspergillus steynii IBT 23096]|uniref:Uncharacterized protein n=1 Tax=Aspergillus steynii IBT 23096 TaxID=1392250 RepID=A0A2I2GNZ4_9EURO|nr:uncharacterized protein P170DRAFT_432225 [Aspergillus steynii IBT 23096]PLB54598.1 hypothetical protein P170DRAFT_432225 [Aspergillus steynii IBT 23096]
MTAIIEKLRRKRKVSSELHARWGDVSISYPTEGSWSQCQSSGGVPNAMPARPSEQSRRHGSLDALDRPAGSSRVPTPLRSGDRKASVDSAMTIPTGHYDAKLRGRSKTKPPYPHSPRAWEEDSDDCSADEDEEEDVPSALGGSRGRYHHHPQGASRAGGREEDPYARASKSPPLSVTSRMRRCSVQSTATEPTTMPTTASSKHSSFVSSVPSVTSEEPRLLYHSVHQDKKPPPLPQQQQQQQQPRRAKPREAESARRQELVPSYDELYG